MTQEDGDIFVELRKIAAGDVNVATVASERFTEFANTMLTRPLAAAHADTGASGAESRLLHGAPSFKMSPGGSDGV